MGKNGSITPAYNVLNEKKSDQTVVPICESPYGLKVIKKRNCHSAEVCNDKPKKVHDF